MAAINSVYTHAGSVASTTPEPGEHVGLIFDIRRYSVHDGPGIRTTVFFKGCPLACWWCHNPEGRLPRASLMFSEERCLSCGECLAVCPHGAIVRDERGIHTQPEICRACGTCVDACPIRIAPLPLNWPAMLNPRNGLATPPPLSPQMIIEKDSTAIFPVMVNTVSSPGLSTPPLRIKPGLPFTPGKSRMAPTPLARISVLVFKVSESPMKVWIPAVAGLRTRVLAVLVPKTVPLATHS